MRVAVGDGYSRPGMPVTLDGVDERGQVDPPGVDAGRGLPPVAPPRGAATPPEGVPLPDPPGPSEALCLRSGSSSGSGPADAGCDLVVVCGAGRGDVDASAAPLPAPGSPGVLRRAAATDSPDPPKRTAMALSASTAARPAPVTIPAVRRLRIQAHSATPRTSPKRPAKTTRPATARKKTIITPPEAGNGLSLRGRPPPSATP